jgi:hypothetical protein
MEDALFDWLRSHLKGIWPEGDEESAVERFLVYCLNQLSLQEGGSVCIVAFLIMGFESLGEVVTKPDRLQHALDTCRSFGLVAMDNEQRMVDLLHAPVSTGAATKPVGKSDWCRFLQCLQLVSRSSSS